ncbi:uncharacterized protein PpBr36_11101 [Pyricularia pennisetigena]|uniref:uncharacterized protein n=1 Tax=Pyricularia pennisetigena TaxID=1578925 RepID=UPI0011547B9C|nr:uncharacterized protein PpBr36_11101 [Pyricularia pennisetigena]TLS20658.1 hypothetical protein PpBr36_11101 [Pyricularia pennisetigena]
MVCQIRRPNVFNQVGITPAFVPPIRVTYFNRRGFDARTVSQTIYDGLLFLPIAVAIKTKIFQGDKNYGLV